MSDNVALSLIMLFIERMARIVDENCQLTGIDEILQWLPNVPYLRRPSAALAIDLIPFSIRWRRYAFCHSVSRFPSPMWQSQQFRAAEDREDPNRALHAFFAPLPLRIDDGKTRPARFRPQMTQDAFR